MVAVPRQIPSALTEMLLRLWNDLLEASEKCEVGGLRQVRGGEEWQCVVIAYCNSLTNKNYGIKSCKVRHTQL